MNHVCINCKEQFDCPMEYCGDQSHKLCSQRCKEEFEEKNDLKNKLHETPFANNK